MSFAAKTIRAILLMVLFAGVDAKADRTPLTMTSLSPVATVKFTMELENTNPPYYSVTVSSMGSASYESLPNSDQYTGKPYVIEFEASSATRTRIFQLAQELRFFQGNFKTSQVASTRMGTKSLIFDEGTIQNSITYSSSKNRVIKRLTAMFENISSTLEYGRRLEQFQTANASTLQAELKQLAQRSRRGQLVEFHAIAPSVQRIASDAAISATSRRWARAILEETHTD